MIVGHILLGRPWHMIVSHSIMVVRIHSPFITVMKDCSRTYTRENSNETYFVGGCKYFPSYCVWLENLKGRDYQSHKREDVKENFLDASPIFLWEYVEDECHEINLENQIFDKGRWTSGGSWESSQGRACAKARVQSAGCDFWSLSSYGQLYWSILGSGTTATKSIWTSLWS